MSATSRWTIPSILTLCSRNPLIILVLVSFALTPLLVPLWAPVALGDDWVYVRSVEILVREGRLHILDLSVVTLLFQVAWGSLFASLFGLSFGVLRLSTFVMVLLGGLATYGLCRELQIARTPERARRGGLPVQPAQLCPHLHVHERSALHRAAGHRHLRVCRGLRTDRPSVDNAALELESLAAACAFLVRQQGALIPLAVVAALLLQRRLSRDCASVVLALHVVTLPVVAVAGYYIWLSLVHGIPHEERA